MAVVTHHLAQATHHLAPAVNYFAEAACDLIAAMRHLASRVAHWAAAMRPSTAASRDLGSGNAPLTLLSTPHRLPASRACPALAAGRLRRRAAQGWGRRAPALFVNILGALVRTERAQLAQ